jgi:hypothetical protein
MPVPPPAIQPAPRLTPPETRPVRPAPPAPREAPAPQPTAGTSWLDRLTANPIWLGGAAAALLGVVAVIFVVRRRRRTLPNDLDVTAIAEEIDGSGRIPAEGFSMEDGPGAHPSASDETSFAGLFDDEEPAAARPAPAPISRPPAPRAPAVTRTPSVTAPAAAAAEADSLFDSAGELADEEPSQGDAPMNQEMDLPADVRKSPATPPRMGGSAAPSPDMTRMFQELERRIQALEARLDETNEAREKLERQVAAQSEELRVQRAAIARTQRALRTMTRPDEDKATEPALREGDTQAKTRINI